MVGQPDGNRRFQAQGEPVSKTNTENEKKTTQHSFGFTCAYNGHSHQAHIGTHNQHQQQNRCSLDLKHTSKDLPVEDLVPGKYSEESLGEVIGS